MACCRDLLIVSFDYDGTLLYFLVRTVQFDRNPFYIAGNAFLIRDHRPQQP